MVEVDSIGGVWVCVEEVVLPGPDLASGKEYVVTR
jgi:hypothetical protein